MVMYNRLFINLCLPFMFLLLDQEIKSINFLFLYLLKHSFILECKKIFKRSFFFLNAILIAFFCNYSFVRWPLKKSLLWGHLDPHLCNLKLLQNQSIIFNQLLDSLKIHLLFIGHSSFHFYLAMRINKILLFGLKKFINIFLLLKLYLFNEKYMKKKSFWKLLAYLFIFQNKFSDLSIFFYQENHLFIEILQKMQGHIWLFMDLLHYQRVNLRKYKSFFKFFLKNNFKGVKIFIPFLYQLNRFAINFPLYKKKISDFFFIGWFAKHLYFFDPFLNFSEIFIISSLYVNNCAAKLKQINQSLSIFDRDLIFKKIVWFDCEDLDFTPNLNFWIIKFLNNFCILDYNYYFAKINNRIFKKKLSKLKYYYFFKKRKFKKKYIYFLQVKDKYIFI